jgi:acetyltransferase-like isoleucine patch superfamily enzyme
MRARIERLWRRPAAGLPFPIGTYGYSLPEIVDAHWHPMISSGSPLSIKVTSKSNSLSDHGNNWVVATKGARQQTHLEIVIEGCRRNNVVVIGRDATFQRRILLQRNDGLIILGEQINWWCELYIRLSSDAELFFWGGRSTSNGASITMEGNGRHVIIGEDCMLATEIFIRNSDLHSLVDMDSNRWLNKPGDILLEPHVWIGQDSMILKNTEVGYGSIIGAKSLVNKSVPRYSLAAGVPARVLREKVSWDRKRVPGPEVANALREGETKLAAR